MGTLLIPIIIIGGMYFFMSRAQKKQQSERQQLLDNLTVGDSVITIGGLHGVIAEIRDDGSRKTVLLDCEGIYLEYNRSAIQQVIPAAAAPEAEQMISDEETEPAEDEKTSEENDQQ